MSGFPLEIATTSVEEGRKQWITIQNLWITEGFMHRPRESYLPPPVDEMCITRRVCDHFCSSNREQCSSNNTNNMDNNDRQNGRRRDPPIETSDPQSAVVWQPAHCTVTEWRFSRPSGFEFRRSRDRVGARMSRRGRVGEGDHRQLRETQSHEMRCATFEPREPGRPHRD